MKDINNIKNTNLKYCLPTKTSSLQSTHIKYVYSIVDLKSYPKISNRIIYLILFGWTLFFFYLDNYSFYMFLVITLVLAAFLALTTASLIYALVFLILTYVIAAVIFFVLGLDFLALCLLFIYAGAIAILFIFVVMTLSPNRGEPSYGFSFFDKLCLFLFSLMLFSVTAFFNYVDSPTHNFYRWAHYNSQLESVHTINSINDNITQIGLLLYGPHTFLFYLVVLILFLGFLIPIVLTIDEEAPYRVIKLNIDNSKQLNEVTNNSFIKNNFSLVMFSTFNNIFLNSPLEMFESNVTGWLGLEISDGAISAIVSFILSYVSSVISTYEVLIEEDSYDLVNDEFNDSLDDVIADNIGDDDDDELVSVIQFIFQTILFSNFINLMPLGDTTSSNLVFTLSMAATCFIALNLNGIFIHSYSMINLFLPHGVPPFLKPMLFVIEIISYFARLFSLGIRLFANMMAGHILIAILFTFFSIMLTNIGIGTVAAIILFVVITAIILLEIIISYLQAYVFGLLVTLYYGDVINLSSDHG